MDYKIDAIEVFVTVPQDGRTYEEVRALIEKEFRLPDTVLDYNLSRDYKLDEVDSDYDDEIDGNYCLRVVYTKG